MATPERGLHSAGPLADPASMIEDRLAHGFAELADLYRRLFAVTARGQAVAFAGRVRGGEPETAPANMLIIDFITAIEHLTLDLEAGLREALGFGQAHHRARPASSRTYS